MSDTSLVISSIIGLAFVLMLAPGVLRMNKGKVLRNVAAWLAIFLLLGLAYQYVGPGKNESRNQSSATSERRDFGARDAEPERGESNVPDQDKGYTPPKED